LLKSIQFSDLLQNPQFKPIASLFSLITSQLHHYCGVVWCYLLTEKSFSIIDDIIPYCGGIAVTHFLEGQVVYQNAAREK